MAITDAKGSLLGERGLGSTAYEHDYFSGSQIQVMIGDVLVDSAVHLDFRVSQERVPVYSYANQYYSFLADGKIIVTGQLTVAFKEAGYFLYSLRRFNELYTSGQWTTPRYFIDKEGILRQDPGTNVQLSDFQTAAAKAEKRRTMRANVEQSLEWEATSAARGQKNEFRKRNNSFVTSLSALKDDAFEDWAEVFEDAIWYGSDPQNTFLRDRVNSGNLPEDELIEREDLLSHRRPDQYPKVDLWIVYGDTNNQATNHTVQKLLDVNFLGSSKTIEVSGEPVYETYPFIARNLV